MREGFEDLPLPSYASSGAAGLDLRAAVESPVVLEPGRRAGVPTGIAIALPPGYECQVRPRIGMVNAPGTVDEDYRGEIFVLLVNHGSEPFTIERGERIAQAVIARYERIEWEEVSSLPETGRGAGGFGSTGRG